MRPAGWFQGPLPRILAHRGLALDSPENSIDAFRAAVAAGASHIETDVRATSDGFPVLVHDPRLADGREIAGLTLEQLRDTAPHIATLPEALAALPDTPFNLDVKHGAAAAPTGAAVSALSAGHRVLLTSFSPRRRRAALRAAPRAATSASADSVLAVVVGVRLRVPAVVTAAARRVQAVQIPERAMATDLSTPWTIEALHRAGAEVHFWVVNDASRMRELVARGADGIVTDRPDLARDALR